ncbi:splicing factor, arginine/serine-rich 15 [Plakobranchus ocellatus]|uniref:Splicing factor, arginine/serine-rich 15 n=1 Tax=Plakobranchus ocellatus TaxID=259542 RepID=A0AAV4BV75_9GAST|nr:splicing factor, arginine/serine-rich 15 [Plakobranchus ocellatus]
MEAVRAFNSELSSLYESKPPVSRAKMAQVTKCAIKAIKFYKHVVQSVEKFIQKCKPEYKVPGLYVVDSIVRQSRHQFGPEKDVFSPRFTKNIVTTFTHLLKCPVEERSRLVRVLNLWQKNNVFPVEVIQPLLDLAADPNNADLVASAQKSVEAVVSVTQKVPLPGTHSSSNGGDASSNQIMQSEMLSTITKLLQQAQDGSMAGLAPEAQLQQLQHLQQQLVMQTERISKPQQATQSTPPIDSNLLAQIQVLTNQLLSKTSGGSGPQMGNDTAGKTAQPPQQKAEPLFNKKLLDFDYGDSDEEDDRQEYHHHHHQQQPQLNRPPPMMPQGRAPPMSQEGNIFQQIQQMSQQQEQLQSEIGAQEQLRRRLLEQQQQQFDREIGQAAMMGHQPQQNFNPDMEREREEEDRDERDSRERRRMRGSRDRSRSRDRERRERERERERRKRGLPEIRDNCLCICSTTLWFGHLTKHTTEEELREHIENYGTIKTINMIPPRGCAFVCLTKRKEAFKALDRLKGVKVNGNSLKVAWAPGIGVKESMFKEYWDVEQGATYIPYDRLPVDITPYLNGGMLDEDTLPERMKAAKSGDENSDEQQQQQQQQHQRQMQQPPPNLMDGGMQMQENIMPPQQMPMNMPGQGPNFPMPGQRPMNMMSPGGPMGMLGMPPPNSMGINVSGSSDNMGGGLNDNNMAGMNNMGVPNNNMGGPNSVPGMNNPMGGPNNMGGPPNSMSGGPPNMPGMNNMNRPNSMGGLPGFGGPRPGMQGMPMRPMQMNLRPQASMMGQGNRMGQPGGSLSPGSDMQNSPMRMNANSPRGPFNQFGGNFQHRMQQGAGLRQPFFNNNNAGDNDHGGITENEMRGMVEQKEWPPDDEINDEDEQDEQEMQMDSDDRMLLRGAGQNQPRLPGPGMANLRALSNLFGPMLAGQRPPGAPTMLGLPQSQAAQNASLQQSILSLRMMAAAQGPQHQMLAMAGGPPGPPRFAMTASGMRIPLPPTVGVRPSGMVPGSPSPRMLTPGAGNPLPVAVSVSAGSVMVSGPGGGPPVPSPGLAMNIAGNAGGGAAPSPDPEVDEDDSMGGPPRPGGQGLPMMLQGTNRPPGGPILGRGFAPMTIRPRGGAGLLGLRPGGGGFNRFGGPRPMMGGGGFGRMERPMFGNRFGAPLRPPVAFFDQDDKDERRLPLLDFDDQPGSQDVDERNRANNGPEKDGANGDKDERQDVDERPQVTTRASGLPSRWSAAPAEVKPQSSGETGPPAVAAVSEAKTPAEEAEASLEKPESISQEAPSRDVALGSAEEPVSQEAAQDPPVQAPPHGGEDAAVAENTATGVENAGAESQGQSGEAPEASEELEGEGGDS